MLVKHKDLKPFDISNSSGITTVLEYGKLNDSLDIGISSIFGEYPGENQYSTNTLVECMTYFVLEGEGIFEFENEEPFKISKGDCIYIGKNKGYRAKSIGDKPLKVLMASSPAWTIEQYKVYKKTN